MIINSIETSERINPKSAIDWLAENTDTMIHLPAFIFALYKSTLASLPPFLCSQNSPSQMFQNVWVPFII
jgi:hypothetical protein